LTLKRRYGGLHLPNTEETAWSDGLKCDTAGRVFVASKSGIQIMDQLGRVNAVLPVPPAKGQVSNMCFGGADFNIMYITVWDKVYRRKLKTSGVNYFSPPIKPVNPRL